MRLEFEPVTTAFPLVENKVFEEGNSAASWDFESLLKNGVKAAQNGDREQARKLLSQATAIDPSSEDAWMWLASISEYPEELQAFLNRVLEINPKNVKAVEWRSATNSLLAKTFVQRAIAAHSENLFELAAQCLDHALSHDNDCELAWFWKAKLAQSDDQKLEFLDRVLNLNPENQETLTAVSEIKRSRSLAAFDEAKAAAAAGNRKKAGEILDNFVKEVPDSVQAWLLKSHLSVGLEGKIEALENALAIDPENAAARSGLAFLTLTFGSADDEDHGQSFPENVDHEGCHTVQPAGEQTAHVIPDESPVTVEFTCEPTGEEVVIDEAAQVGTESENLFDREHVAEESVENSDLVPEFATGEYDPAPDAEIEVEPYTSAENEPAEDYRFETEESLVQSVEEMYGLTAEPVYAASETVESLSGYVPDPIDENPFETETTVFATEEGTDVFDPAPDPVVPEPEHIEPKAFESPQFDLPTEEIYTGFACPFCGAPNDPQAFDCTTCRATLTLSDIEVLLASSHADQEMVHRAVTNMEAEWNLREFSERELTVLGLGHLNLNNFESGFKYLQEASRLNPNNVMLAGQVNTIAIRLDEMRRQSENYDARPVGKTILVVDDSPTVRKLIAGKLEKSGHTVVCAVDGIDALAQLENGMPDLVLLDITMPRMDGYEVCKQIRSNPAGKDLPIVMISGKDGFFDKVRGRMAGTTGYVTKPFGPETLMKALETYLLPETVEVS